MEILRVFVNLFEDVFDLLLVFFVLQDSPPRRPSLTSCGVQELYR